MSPCSGRKAERAPDLGALGAAGSIGKTCRFLSFEDLNVFRGASREARGWVGRGTPELRAARRIGRVMAWYMWYLHYNAAWDPCIAYGPGQLRSPLQPETEDDDSAPSEFGTLSRMEEEEPPVPHCFRHLRQELVERTPLGGLWVD